MGNPFKAEIPCTKKQKLMREVTSCPNCRKQSALPSKPGRKTKKKSQSLKMLINKMDGVGVSVHASVCSTTTTTTTTTTRTNTNGTHTTTTTITQSTQSPNMNMQMEAQSSSDAIPLGM